MNVKVFKNRRSSGACNLKVIGIFCICAYLVSSSFALVQPAYAHKVNIFAYAENGRIHAEGYFVDGSKCKNSLVEVIDEKSGEKLLEGYTDENGQYVIDIPRATSIKLILHAGTGHQNEYVLKEEEVKEAYPQKERMRTTEALPQKETTAPEKLKAGAESNATQGKKSPHVNQGKEAANTASYEIDAAVERAIDKKLQPVMRILLTLQEKSEKPGVTEILGGIGYIIGILGIIAYFKGRGAHRKP